MQETRFIGSSFRRTRLSARKGTRSATDPGPSWFLDVLISPPPGGVRSDPGPDGRGLTTLCTLVADLTGGEAVIAARGEPPVAIPLADLAEGASRAQRPFRPAKF